MKLTERQRWDVIRAMVKQKNDEYSAFLLRFFDQKQMSQIVGVTRNSFWNKCRNNQTNPLVVYDNKPSKSSTSWLDDLSSEDLLIFLDYRCRLLQQLYRYYKMNRTLDKDVINKIAQSTPISELIAYNDGYLMHTGKPSRTKDEVKVGDLGLDRDELMNEVLAETMGILASTYAKVKNLHISAGKSLALKLVTYNATPDGHKIGCQFNGEINNCPPLSISKLKMVDTHEQKELPPEERMTLYGFDTKGFPVYIKNGEYVNLLGEPVDGKNIKYDINRNEIEQHSDEQIIAKHIGFDGQGRPVYEYDNVYYNSIGERVEEDQVLPNYEDDFGF